MASRTPAMIEAQKAYAAKVAKENLAAASQVASIQATPPGYITGFKVVLTPEYKIDIYPGCANVAGQRVELKKKYTLRPEDESIIRLSASWWYLYLDRAGKIYGDVLAPTYDSTYMAYNHPNRPWRNIGRYFVGEDHLTLFASNWQQASEQTVYVAPKNFGGIANYYCTGVDDQILINAAILYLHEAYDGGICRVLQGNYVTKATITLYSNVSIVGEGKGSIITSNQASGYLITGTAVTRVKIAELKLVSNNMVGIATSGAAKYNIFTDLTLDGVATGGGGSGITIDTGGDNNRISNIEVFNHDVGIDAVGDYLDISKCLIYSCQTGISCSGSRMLIFDNHILNNSASGLTIAGTSNKITNNYCYNNGADTGIANTNSNNFTNSGTDTQVYSNSWQQPVASEPSLGTYKPLLTPYAIRTTATATTATTGYHTISSTAVPVGARMIDVRGYIVTTAVNSALTISRMWPSTAVVIYAVSQVATYQQGFNGIIPLSSTNGFKWATGSTLMTFNVTANGYWA